MSITFTKMSAWGNFLNHDKGREFTKRKEEVSNCWEGNGSPLQCSCLENPRDGGARWAAVYRVAQSQTRLKRLSSSSRESWNLKSRIWDIQEMQRERAPEIFIGTAESWLKIHMHVQGWYSMRHFWEQLLRDFILNRNSGGFKLLDALQFIQPVWREFSDHSGHLTEVTESSFLRIKTTLLLKRKATLELLQKIWKTILGLSFHLAYSFLCCAKAFKFH